MMDSQEFDIEFAGMVFTAEEFKEMCSWYIDKYVEDRKDAQ
jgi:hypothetical protein